jgi:ABC-2 type transport system ATP-binding protein/lipopolysaccharide transport system ATP-binding protein
VSDPVIAVEGVSVRFRVPHERITSLKEYAVQAARRRVRHEEFWALRDVSFTVEAGEVFALIGRNGAGKSTLLKVVARVLRPTTGRVRVRGQVAPLLEFGAAFHPELTGRENVFLNGTLLGRSRRQLAESFERIVEFAELFEFIDAPLRTYSSGMVARLGFAIATDVRPEVLIVDEGLSVGDTDFQAKSTRRIQEFRESGTTIILVSHHMAYVTDTCTRAAWLDHGALKALGPVADVVRAYRGLGALGKPPS